MSLLYLPKEVIKLLKLNPIESSNLRATCKQMYKVVEKPDEKYIGVPSGRTIMQYPILTEMRMNVKPPTRYDWLLLCAAMNNDIEVAQWCKAVHFNVACAIACYYGHIEIAEWCLKQNHCIDYSLSLEYACKGGYVDMIEFCILHRLHPRYSCPFIDTINLACTYGQLDVLKYMVKEYRNSSQFTSYSIISAIQNGHKDVVSWIISLDYDLRNMYIIEELVLGHFAHPTIKEWLAEQYNNNKKRKI